MSLFLQQTVLLRRIVANSTMDDSFGPSKSIQKLRSPVHSIPGVVRMNALLPLLGRAGLSAIFILSGLAKLGAYAGTQQYMDAAGVPGVVLPLVILLEVGGGLAVLAGAFTRPVSIALALFSIAAGVLFHADFGDQNQFIHFSKNLAMAGGFLMLAAHGAGAWSIDAWRHRHRVATVVLPEAA
jgi:putative oxidoreductase